MTCSSPGKTFIWLLLTFLTSGLWGCATSPEFKKLFDPNTTYPYFQKSNNYPFYPEARTFNKVNVAWLADAAMLAYCDFGFVKENLEKAGFKKSFFPFNNKGTQGYIASNGEAVFIIFRGTEIQEPEDLLYDANFFPTSEGNGKVHKGFQDALNAVWVEVEKQLDKVTKSERPSIWFGGHSLGGAIASLAAGRWKVEHPEQMVSLYTFGAPGIGNKDYVRHYPIVTVVRVIDNEDQVAKTEHKGFFIDLRHPGGVIVKYERPSKMLTEKKHTDLPDGLADHAPIYYAENSWRQVIEKDR